MKRAQVAQQFVRILQGALRHPHRLEQDGTASTRKPASPCSSQIADNLRDLVADLDVGDVESGWWE